MQWSISALGAWDELIRSCEFLNVITNMYLKDKLQTLKMGKNESVTKHIHIC
jgi:hypothetical protein